MPRIDLDIFARLHQATLRKTEKEAQKRFQDLGNQAGEDLARGITTASPKIRRAMNTAADSTLDLTRKTRDLQKVEDQRNKTLEEQARLENAIADRKSKRASLARTEQNLTNRLTEARRDQVKVNKEVIAQEAEIDAMQQRHNRTLHELNQKELKRRDIRVNRKPGWAKANRDMDKALQPLRKRREQEAADLRDAKWILAQTRDSLNSANASMSGFDKELTGIRKELGTATKDLSSDEAELTTVRDRLTKVDEDRVRINEDVEKSTRRRHSALKALADAEMDHEKNSLRRNRGGGNGGRSKSKGAAGVVGNMLTELPFVPSGPAGAVIGGGMLVVLGSAAEAITTATQAIGAMPAVLTAAVAGIGTLALGFQGFLDVIGDVNDPEKFAKGIQALSPAAQQAALEIQYLVQGPLKDLQQATSETLFAGAAEQIHTLTDNLLPQAQALTQGVAQSFNNMFDNAINQLISPESKESLSNIVDDIVRGFQALEPAVAPFISAMTKLTETGMDFWPMLTENIANAAIAFNDFITKAQQDGSLREWIYNGINALKAIKDVLWDLGKRIYDTFGNKSPEQFKQTLDSAIDGLFSLAQAIVGISNVVNNLLKVIQPVADALGGWEGLITAAGLAFVAWKSLGILTTLGEMAGLLGMGAGGVGGGLAAIPGLAGAAVSALGPLVGIVAGLTAAGAGAWWLSDKLFDMDPLNRSGFKAPPFIPNMPNGFNGQPVPGSSPGTGGIPMPELTEADRVRLQYQGIDPSTAKVEDIYKGLGKPVPAPVPAGTRRVGDKDVPIWTAPTAPGPGSGATAGLPDYKPFDVPAPPPEKGGPSQSKQVDEIMSGMDPSQFMPQGPIGMPGLPAMPVQGGGMPVFPGGVPNLKDTGSVASGPLSQNAAALIMQMFGNQIRGPIGGSRDGNTAPGTHDKGLSIDIPIGPDQMDLGDQINAWLQANAQSLGLKYSIWRDKGQQTDGGTFNTPGHQNHIDAHFQDGNGAGLPPLQYGTGGKPYAKPGMGYYDVDPVAQYKAQNRLDREGNDVAQARMRLEALKKVGATQQEIREAETKVKEEEASYNEAYLNLVDTQNGTWKKVNQSKNGKGLFSDMLDSDFGISKGIPGVVENMTKFLLSMAFAPMLGQLAMAGGQGPDGSMGSPQYPYGPGGVPNGSTPGPGNFSGYGQPGTPQATANMIYQQALSRGYSPQEAQAIVAYAIGESSLNPGSAPGAQGGSGAENEVVGLFQMKPAFARGGGIDPSMRTDPVANTYAYLNQLEKNRNLPIEQALPATSVGGPLASGPGAQPQNWGNLMNQAKGYLGGFNGTGGGPAAGGGGGGWGGFGIPGLNLPGFGGGGGGGPGMGFPQSPVFGGGAPQSPLGGPPGGAPLGAAAGSPIGGGGSPIGPGAAPVGGTPNGGWQPQGGGASGGSLLGAATAAGAMAADAFAPGAGMAVQKAGQLGERAIKFGGQLAGIGVSGLMETFGLGGSVLGDPQKSWIGRLASGLSQMKPAQDTNAGQTQAPVPDEQQQQQGQQGPGGPTVNIENFTQAPGRNGQQTANDLAFKAHGAWGKP